MPLFYPYANTKLVILSYICGMDKDEILAKLVAEGREKPTREISLCTVIDGVEIFRIYVPNTPPRARLGYPVLYRVGVNDDIIRLSFTEVNAVMDYLKSIRSGHDYTRID